MANPSFFKEVFDSLATDGSIGSPKGELAYCYIRVSASDQAEEGRSGLPRQIRNIHEVALQRGYRIPWDMVFADDHSGFEFDGRPELTKLRKEYTSKKCRATVIIMEILDRLSRNADWHQGFLLDEMKRFGIKPIFWKHFGSRIERTVMGAVSQDGMEQAKQRMAEGNLHKARQGRITARTPAFGYRIVDGQGQPGYSAKRDTHYAIDPENAPAIQYMYEAIAYSNIGMGDLTRALQEKYAPPKQMRDWEISLIKKIIRNPLYKGEFYAHRWIERRVPKPDQDGVQMGAMQYVKKRWLRPPEEWVSVDVPAIVSPELWDAANQGLEDRRAANQLVKKNEYLLRGIVECATCGLTYMGRSKVYHQNTRNGPKDYKLFSYRCPSRAVRKPGIRSKLNCSQPMISAKVLENTIWSLVYGVLLDPQILIRSVESQFYGEENSRLMEQIAFLEREIGEKDIDDQKLWKAYRAVVFGEEEYVARRQELKDARVKLKNELSLLRAQAISSEEVDEKKQQVLAMCAAARAAGCVEDAPFEVKRRVIRMMVKRIVLNANEGWVKLEGMMEGIFPLIREDWRKKR